MVRKVSSRPSSGSANEAIAVTDTPHVLSAAFVYQLPFGSGKRFLNAGGVRNALLGGWQISTIFRASSGLPLFFRVGGTACNVPGPFRAGCIPAIINPDAVFAQEKGSFDPAKGPLLDVTAFEPVSAFNFYRGRGNRIEESVRGFGYHNQDLAFVKNTRVPGGTNLQLRVEVFNFWNWHMFTYGAWGNAAFNTDLSSPRLRHVERDRVRPTQYPACGALRVLIRTGHCVGLTPFVPGAVELERC